MRATCHAQLILTISGDEAVLLLYAARVQIFRSANTVCATLAAGI